MSYDPVTDQLEQWVARLQADVSLLQRDLNAHAQKPLHDGYAEMSDEIISRLKGLEGMWIKVGGTIIVLLLGILGSLIGVLLTLIRSGATVPLPHIT